MTRYTKNWGKTPTGYAYYPNLGMGKKLLTTKIAIRHTHARHHHHVTENVLKVYLPAAHGQFKGPNLLTLSEQQCYVWNTASQKHKMTSYAKHFAGHGPTDPP